MGSTHCIHIDCQSVIGPPTLIVPTEAVLSSFLSIKSTESYYGRSNPRRTAVPCIPDKDNPYAGSLVSALSARPPGSTLLKKPMFPFMAQVGFSHGQLPQTQRHMALCAWFGRLLNSPRGAQLAQLLLITIF